MNNVVALAVATIVLVMIPGPNVAIIVAKSLQQGFFAGFSAALGTTAGVAAQLVLISVGVAALVEAAASALLVVKWLGVVYLIGLGVRTWCSRTDEPGKQLPLSRTANFGHGLVVSVLNPKILMFNAAFLPQFVDAGAAASQLIILNGVYLSVLLAGDLLWALFATSARQWLGQYSRLGRRLTGGFLAGAGIGLALSRRSV